MKRFFSLTVALMMLGAVSAQQDKGGISEDMLNELRAGYTATEAQKAARNALAVNPISELSVNADNLAMIDTHFSHRVKTKGITDQQQSGRCWLFTGLNVLRAKMIASENLETFEFSQVYNFFFDGFIYFFKICIF